MDDPGRSWRKYLWALPIFVCGAILFCLCLPILGRAREQARQSSCGNNLGNLIKCCQLYAEAHNGTWPDRLSQLYPHYVRSLSVFNCPSAPGPGVQRAEEIDEKTSYRYFPERLAENPETAAIIEEKPGNHPHGEGHVAIGAGSVEWWDEDSERAVKDRGN